MTTSTQAEITPFKKEFWTEGRDGEKKVWVLKNHSFIKGVYWGMERFQEIYNQFDPQLDPEDDDTDESGMDSLNESGMDGFVSQYSPVEAVDALTGETADVEAVVHPDSSDLLNETPYPWEKWAQLPKEEREAETNEAAKQFAKGDQDEIAYAQLDQAEPLIGMTVGISDEKHIPPFPFWDIAEQTTDTEAVGGHFFDTAEPEAVGRPRGLFPLPDFSDQSANVDEQQNTQVDPVTGYSLNNDDTAGFDWFQMNHDDGIMDGYLDTAENTNGSLKTTEPIPEFTLFLPGQAIKLEESGMDGLVAAGPFDAVTPNDPQKNDVF